MIVADALAEEIFAQARLGEEGIGSRLGPIALALRVLRQDQAVRFGPCDPVQNRHRGRTESAVQQDSERTEAGSTGNTTPFDPIAALLQKAREATDE